MSKPRDAKRADKPASSRRSRPRGRWATLGSGLFWVSLVAAVGAAAAFGLKALEARVVASDAPGAVPTSVRVRMSPIPAWMPWSLACHIATGALAPDADFNDPSLGQSVYERLSANSWVRSVRHVLKKRSDDPLTGILEIEANFREPVAVVVLRDGRAYAFVDAEGVRLADEPNAPGAARWVVTLPATADRPAREVRYWTRSEVPPGSAARPAHYVLIEGAAAPPPAPGREWEGKDLADGLRLAMLLRPKRYGGQVVSVDVRNHGGRVLGNSGAAHITVHARARDGEPVEVRFGRFPAPYGDYIVPVETRMANLDAYVARCGGAFGVHRKIDLRYDRIHAE